MVGELALRASLPRTISTSRDARHDLGTWLPQRCGPVAAETAVLLASELVTNAVVHTRSAEVGLVAKCDGDTLLVAVYDEAPASPISGEGVTTGTGIELVDSLADRWGWERLPAGKRVWFEVSCAERRDTTSGGGVAPDRCCETTA